MLSVLICVQTLQHAQARLFLRAVAFPGLRSLCLAINKSLWINGEAGSQYSCVRVWAGQWNDWSTSGLSTRKNAVWWDCRLGAREGQRTGADFQSGDKRYTWSSQWILGEVQNMGKSALWHYQCFLVLSLRWIECKVIHVTFLFMPESEVNVWLGGAGTVREQFNIIFPIWGIYLWTHSSCNNNINT